MVDSTNHEPVCGAMGDDGPSSSSSNLVGEMPLLPSDFFTVDESEQQQQQQQRQQQQQQQQPQLLLQQQQPSSSAETLTSGYIVSQEPLFSPFVFWRIFFFG